MFTTLLLLSPFLPRTDVTLSKVFLLITKINNEYTLIEFIIMQKLKHTRSVTDIFGMTLICYLACNIGYKKRKEKCGSVAEGNI